jgi:hypothetical protein
MSKPGYNAITCEWLELMGLWNTKYCCKECHAEEEGHWLEKFKVAGHTVMICFKAGSVISEEAIERKLNECNTRA